MPTEIVLTGPGILSNWRETAGTARSSVHRLEIRLDLTPHLPAGWAAEPLPPLVVSCRRRQDGGNFDGSEEERLRLFQPWLDILPPGTVFDLEWNGGLVRLREEYPDRLFLLSHHDLQGTPADLDGLLQEMVRQPAWGYKVVTMARSWPEVARYRGLLALARERGVNLSAFPMGDAGEAGRLFCQQWGTRFLYLAAGEPLVPGMLTLARYLRLYRAGRMNPASKFYGILGNPVGHSLSPLLHNWIFEATHQPHLYVPLPVTDWDGFCAALPRLPLAGFSVTAPYKEAAGRLCRSLSPEPLALQAVNTVTWREEGWHGDNTDWDGFLQAFRQERPEGGRVLVLGGGGAARAVVYALRHQAAELWIWNRDQARLGRLRADFPGIRAAQLPLPEVDVLINTLPPAVPLTEYPDTLWALRPDLAMDLTYNPPRPAFLEKFGETGVRGVNGLAMFVHQALRQQAIWSGKPAGIKFEEAFTVCLPATGRSARP